MSLIKLVNIDKQYQVKNKNVIALNNISLTIERGEMVAIAGPSGSGKSTLMNIIGLLDTNYAGDYIFCDTHVTRHTEKELAVLRNQAIGFVFQSFFLMPHMNVLKNILLPLTYQTSALDKDRLNQLLFELKIEHLLEHLPNQLSGGQQQRVAIARALIMQPKLILADEPTGALDIKTGNNIMDIFTALHKSGHTILIITHDRKVSAQCQRVIEINEGLLTSQYKN